MARKLICLTGMPGAGKTVVAEVARELGLRVYSMGNVVREEVLKEKGHISWEEVKKAMFELRRREGPRAIAKRVVKVMMEDEWDVAIIEGVRSLEEIEEFKTVGNVIILAIHSSPLDRYIRLRRRNREDDPKSLEEMRDRDFKELSLGLGNVIALADLMMVNDGTLEDFKEKAKKVLLSLAERGS
ncbi:MAG: AAA family ATPase [Candidatus Nezhaarchaeota archaeon]|nr:AAA family ATPase [Candidatus Nezhaarchaeota archaeon]MCX8142074.1 AAA family ATPase [Candidatus Nezhaarchaeota archaeon]MDW8050145.1 AAA family ATPase [Nitrososphaerota archaeon]